MPGQIGLLQATEAIKLILKKGTPLIGKYLVYQSLDSDFRVFTVRKNPSCPLCNKKPKIKSLIDHQEVCSLESMGSSAA